MARVMWAAFLCKREKNHFCKGETRRCLAGEEQRLSLEGKKIPAHMTRAIVEHHTYALSGSLKSDAYMFYRYANQK
jgi:hypothetical protein